jgi:hypothetical protein
MKEYVNLQMIIQPCSLIDLSDSSPLNYIYSKDFTSEPKCFLMSLESFWRRRSVGLRENGSFLEVKAGQTLLAYEDKSGGKDWFSNIPIQHDLSSSLKYSVPMENFGQLGAWDFFNFLGIYQIKWISE